jgi:hypothetical protein
MNGWFDKNPAHRIDSEADNQHVCVICYTKDAREGEFGVRTEKFYLHTRI